MFDYEKLFEPYTKDGCSLEMLIDWIKEKTKADGSIIDQAVSTIMQELSDGASYQSPCPCCGVDNAHRHISHRLLSITSDLVIQFENAKIKILENAERSRLDKRLRQITNLNKQAIEAAHGNWWQRNTPTFRRWLKIKD